MDMKLKNKTYTEAFERLERIPRVKLGFLPTPLQKLQKLSDLYGAEIYIKRDDLTGVEFGGNKTRKLEFALPEAIEKKADYLVTSAAFQSNWCRQVVATGIRCGMRTILYLNGPEIPQDYRGNLLLDKVMGAEVHLVKLQPGETLIQGRQRTEGEIAARIKELEGKGHICHFMAVGAPFPSGHMGYAYAMGELVRQLKEIHMQLDDLDYIVTAVGTGGTYTGLLVGKKLFNSTVSIYGFAVSRMHPTMGEDVLREAKATADFFALPIKFSQDDSHISFDYVGEGYDIPSAGGTEAIKQVAREEAVLLDPVYTGKAMAGLLDFIKAGKIPQGAKVLFWHTGGLPAVFAEEKIAGPIYQE